MALRLCQVRGLQGKGAGGGRGVLSTTQTLWRQLVRFSTKPETIAVEVKHFCFSKGETIGESVIGQAIPVLGGVPGEVVEVENRKKHKLPAIKRGVVSRSNEEATPHCQHFLECGGCKYQNVQYRRQLEEKQRYVESLFGPFQPRVMQGEVRPIRAAGPVYSYRNNLEFSVSAHRWIPRAEAGATKDSLLQQRNSDAVRSVVGFNVRGRRGSSELRLLEVQECHLIHPSIGQRILPAVREIMERIDESLSTTEFSAALAQGREFKSDEPLLGTEEFNGDKPTLAADIVQTIRIQVDKSESTEAPQVGIEFSVLKPWQMVYASVLKPIVSEVFRDHGLVQRTASEDTAPKEGTATVKYCTLSFSRTTVPRVVKKQYLGATETQEEYQAKITQYLRGTRMVLLGDEPCLWASIHGIDYRLSPGSFFQPNFHGAESIFETISELCELNGTQRVLDLFCGTGSIGISLGSKARSIYGIDLSSSAIDDARQNALRNGVTNTYFVAGDLSHCDVPVEDIDVVIVDPPRAGLHKSLVKQLAQIPWQKLVYVSCQPKTCIRDIALLVEEYRQVYGPDTLLQIKAVQPTDQFPHTPHVEVVTLIEKVGDVGGGDTEDSIDEQ